MNAFATLGLPVELTLAADEIDLAWRDAGARLHPDAGGLEAAFAELLTAREMVASPAERLAHWLTLHGYTVESRGSIAPAVMDLFGQVADATRQAEELARRRAAATTALGLAMLESETLRARESVETIIAKLDVAIADNCAGFTRWQKFPDSIDAAEASVTVRGLRFLERWKRMSMAAYAGLA